MEENYYCKICDCEITKWQHENNDDICTFCQEELDEDTPSVVFIEFHIFVNQSIFYKSLIIF